MNIANFVESLKYMGIGMVGIFVIISLIVVLIGILKKVFSVSGEEGK